MEAPAANGGQHDNEAKQKGQQLSCVAMGLLSIASVPDLESIQHLTKLCLHGNRLSSLEGLGHLTALRELVLSSNALPALGRGLSGLLNLRTLDLTSNALTNVEGLGGLTALQHLVRLCPCGVASAASVQPDLAIGIAVKHISFALKGSVLKKALTYAGAGAQSDREH